MRRHNKKAYPLLAGEVIEGGERIRVWCPYCKCYHRHGWSADTPDSDAEHRAAHCSGESPFKNGGYYITVLPKEKYAPRVTVIF